MVVLGQVFQQLSIHRFQDSGIIHSYCSGNAGVFETEVLMTRVPTSGMLCHVVWYKFTKIQRNMLPPSPGIKYYLLDFLFNPEDGDSTFL
jgi:hypothetical protein